MKDHFLVVSSPWGKLASFVGGIHRSANMITTLSFLSSLSYHVSFVPIIISLNCLVYLFGFMTSNLQLIFFLHDLSKTYNITKWFRIKQNRSGTLHKIMKKLILGINMHHFANLVRVSAQTICHIKTCHITTNKNRGHFRQEEKTWS